MLTVIAEIRTRPGQHHRQAVLDQFHLTHGEKDPKGFLSRVSGFQEVISMRLEL